MIEAYGFEALIRVVSHLAFVYMSYWTINSLRLEEIFKKNHIPQIRLFCVLLAIAIGYSASSFFLEIIALLRNFISII